MIAKYEKGKNKISIGSNIVPLQAPIWSVFEYNSRVLVTLDPKWGSRNIFCYDQTGQLLWTVEKAEYFKNAENHGYSATWIGDSGRLENRLIATMYGRPFFLDIETGKVEFIPGNFEK